MHVKLVDDLAHLRTEWPALHASDPSATPFGSLEWLSAWCRDWADGARPWILAVYDGDRLAGAAAFVRRDRMGLRLLNGMGVGVGNYWDVIAAPADREAVVAVVAATLTERSSEWDAFFMDKLPEASTTREALRGTGLRLSVIARHSSPRIPLPETFDDYLAGLSKSRRWRIRRNLKALDEGGLKVRTISDPTEVRRALERWQALRAEWWEKRERAMNDEHASERFLSFTQDVVLALLRVERALVWELSEADQLVGIAVNFLDENTFYYWLWGLDARFQKLRPGHALLAYAIRWSIDTGRRYFDFMLGDEDYKYDYAPHDDGVLTVTVTNRRARSRVAFGLLSLRRLARPSLKRLSGSRHEA